jgi:hypothetical protein
MACRKFNRALSEAVDFTFLSLGKSCRQALYFHLRTTFYIRRNQIPKQIEKFDKALKFIFKDGALFLNRLILEKLCDNLNIKFRDEYASNFVDSISEIRKMFNEKESLLITTNFSEIAITETAKGGERT